MDGSSFDAFTQLVAAISRRRIAQTAAIAALTAFSTATFPAADVAAGRKARRRRRRRKKDKGKDRCLDLGDSCIPKGKRPCCRDLLCGTIRDVGGDRCCGDDGASCDIDADCCGDQTYCHERTCAPCLFACGAGERCVHGTCTCDSFANTCPLESPTDRCACSGDTVDGAGPTCAKRNSACDLDKPCLTHGDCPEGSVCKTTCVEPGDPLGPNRCSRPCVSV